MIVGVEEPQGAVVEWQTRQTQIVMLNTSMFTRMGLKRFNII
jgi:hypothetical protein